MRNLIICLGFNPKNDGSILPILEHRLKNCIELCRKNPGSLLILSGGYTYRERAPNGQDQSLLMKKYIEDHASDILPTTEILTENSASTTVRELCFLRMFIDEAKENFKITIVGSAYFIDRVKLYSEYIFKNPKQLTFVASEIPDSAATFKEIEQDKLRKGLQWLNGHRKGDYLTILQVQDEFEKKVLTGEIENPVSR
jgi:hypothetical protein